MRICIAGTRDYHDYETLCFLIKKSGFKITEVCSGCAKGVDALGERWANENNVPIKRFPANWKELGRAAGPSRNYEMARYADGLIAICMNESPGTMNMIMCAESQYIPSIVLHIKENG